MKNIWNGIRIEALTRYDFIRVNLNNHNDLRSIKNLHAIHSVAL